MTVSGQFRTLLSFGPFQVDLRAGELRKQGMKIRLRQQPLKVLTLLLENPGEVVTRDELKQAIWPRETFVDFDVGLDAAIYKLRQALGDSADSPRFVETLPRRGYRFIAAVESTTSTPQPDLATHAQAAAEQPVKALAILRPAKLWILVGALAAMLVLFVGLNIGGLRQRFLRTSATRTVQAVAVLPLENLSGDPTQEYFADGITEALITDLGKIGELRVISRTSVMRYKGTKKPLQEIARELQVDALVEGTVARSGDRVRITANLIQASPEKHLWAETFERNLRDVLALQDEVSLAIANGVRVRLTPQEQARLASAHPVNPEAYEAYLEGRYFSEKLWPLVVPKASEYFELAIRKDPAWALPYSGLADSYSFLGVNAAIPNEFCRKAKEAALEGVKRDDRAAETHLSLADVEYWCDWDWLGAEREIKQAIELNPNFARAHSSYGRYLLTIGRADEGLAETKRAVELDPLSLEIRWDRWLLLYLTGQYDGALEQCRKIEELYPTIEYGHLYCGDAEVQKGNLVEAIRELQEAVTLSEGRNARTVAHLAYAYALAGRRNDAQNLLAKLLEMSKQRYIHPVLVARVYAGLGQKQDAFEWLEKAYQVHGRDLLELKYDPRFGSLRSDPRFNDLLRRIGLPP